MATGVKKKKQSVRSWYDLLFPGAKCVRKKNPVLTDRGVAIGVTKFRMASGGLRMAAIGFT